MDGAMDRQFPVGKYQRPSGPLDAASRRSFIDQIERMPAEFRQVASSLNESQLATPYRPGGWTARQVIHHVPDSHMNAFIRFKLAVTEDTPTIKPYDEKRWAELADTGAPISVSLDLLEAVHHRWVMLLRSFGPAEFLRAYRHPEMGEVPLDAALALYAWHGAHHTAHLKLVRD
jgi:DinB superfamily